jgi:hypothetical protein
MCFVFPILRSIRPGVQWRKVSFDRQSESGSRFVESLLTVVATLKQQKRNVLDYLKIVAIQGVGSCDLPSYSIEPAVDGRV